jgi:site-specific recombinase XerD
MIKVIFFLKTAKVKLTGECPIYCKLSLGRETTVLSTGKNITKERWDVTNKLRISLRTEKEKVAKQSLEVLQLKIERTYNEFLKFNPEVRLEEIKNAINGNLSSSDNIIYLLPIFDKHNKDFKKRVEKNERTPASLQKYNRSKDLVKSFLKSKYGLEDIDIEKVNSAFIYNLESFLKYESVYKGKVGIDNNSVVKYFKNFKTICNYGIKLELIQKNPFEKYDGKIKTKEAIFLTQKELNSIENIKLSVERLDRVRDIFLFSCYTGYAPVDACKLTHDNIIKDGYDNLWIKTQRAKTSIKANVPVLPSCKKIIDKYDGKQPTLLPKLSNQKMNSYLKELADLCGINKYLTWYVSRHTFATTVTLGNGVKIENVSSMMGHSNIKQTQHYAKVLDFNIMEDMSKLMEKYK